MKIRTLHIDAFGLYTNVTLRDLPDGIIVFYGPNESGKTTLMHFLRTILFGFPSRTPEHAYYPPFHGGKHKGSCTVELPGGEHITFRLLGKKLTIDTDGGQRFPDPDMLFRGVNRELFSSIFAIGLEDLQKIDTIRSHDKWGQILTAGGDRGAERLPQSIRSLQLELQKLFKPGGRKPRLNALYSELQHVRRSIRELQRRSQSFQALIDDREKLEQEKEELIKKRTQTEQQKNRLERLMKALGHWENRKAYLKKCETFAFAQNFPLEHYENFCSLLQERHMLQDKINNLKDKIDKQKKTIEEIHLNSDILSNETHIKTLTDTFSLVTSKKEELRELHASLALKQAELEKKLRELGPEWTIEAVLKVPVDLKTLHFAQTTQSEKTLLREKLTDIEGRQYEMKRNLNALTTQKKAVEKELESFKDVQDTTLEDLYQTLQNLETIDEYIVHLSHLQDKIESKQFQQKNYASELKLVEDALWNENTMTRYLPLGVLSGGLITGLIFYLLHHKELAFALMLVGLLSAIITSWVGKRLHLQFKKIAAQKEHIIQIMQQEKRDLDNLEKEYEHDIKQLSKLLKSLPVQVSSDPRSNIPSRETIRTLIASWEKKIEKKKEAIMLEKKLENDILPQLDSLQAEYTTLTNQITNLKTQQDTLEKKWQSFLREKHIHTFIEPEIFPHFIQTVEMIQGLYAQIHNTKTKITSIEEFIQNIQNELEHIFHTCGLEVSDILTLEAQMTFLKQRLDSEKKKKQEYDQLCHIIDEYQSQVDETLHTIETISNRIKRILEMCQVDNEEEMHRYAEAKKQYDRLREKIEHEEYLLRQLLGSSDAWNELEHIFSNETMDTLEEKRTTTLQEYEELTNRLDDVNYRIGELAERIHTLQNEKRLSELFFRESQLEAELQDGVRNWAVLTLCRWLLTETQKIYEKERQPEVIQAASEYLRIMTQRPYRLVLKPDDRSLFVYNDKNEPRHHKQWSSGLADQVYLATRFGVIRSLSRTALPLPIILDEILVRFDPERQTQTLRLLYEIAREHQIFYFTCHPETRDMLYEIGENSHDIPFTFFKLTDGKVVTV